MRSMLVQPSSRMQRPHEEDFIVIPQDDPIHPDEYLFGIPPEHFLVGTLVVAANIEIAVFIVLFRMVLSWLR